MVQRKITGWGQPTVKVGNKTYTDCVKDTCQLSVEEGSVEERFFFMVQAQLAELDLDEAKKYIERVNENIS